MADGFAAPQHIKIRADILRRHAAIIRQPADNGIGIAHAVKFGAVASGQDNGFRRCVYAQIVHGFGQRIGGEGKLFADGQGGGLVVESDNGEFHG